MLGVYLAKGVMYAEGVKLTAFNSAGAEIAPLGLASVATDTTGWWRMEPGCEDTSKALVIDFPSLIPRPAGKGGFISAKGSELVDGEGRAVRFWGANMSFGVLGMEKEEITCLAERYSRLGMNIVRLHHLDNGWSRPLVNLFDKTRDDTQALDPKMLDKLDLFVSECKRRGVYIYLDLLGSRKFKRGDEVRDWEKLDFGAKLASQFNRRLIELQKKYASQLFAHVNPYTGLRYSDEPAIVMAEIINESNMFMAHVHQKLPESYRAELEGLFKSHCERRGMGKFDGGVQALLARNDRTVLEFLLEVQDSYHREMYDYLRNEVGAHCLITGSNYFGPVADVISNARLDFIDRHAYWDHPDGGFTPECVFTNKSMIRELDGKKSIITELARYRVSKKPMVVSEWNFCWPNEYITEGPLLMAAYSCFQDWNGMMLFTMEDADWSGDMAKGGCFNTGGKPHFLAAFAAAAVTFHRRDIVPGPLLQGRLDLANLGEFSGKAISNTAIISHRFENVLCGNDIPHGDIKSVASGMVAAGDGQLRWEKRGMFMVTTPSTQAAAGFFGENRVVELPDVKVEVRNDFAQIIVVSLDDKPIAASNRILISATARAEDEGQVYKIFKKGLARRGGSPILLEKVEAKLTFINRSDDQRAPVASVVDWHGRRTEVTIPATRTKTGIELKLGTAPGCWFELSCPAVK